MRIYQDEIIKQDSLLDSEKIGALKNVKKLLVNSSNITFFTGAGISTSAGIDDFKTQEKNWPFELTRSEVFSYPFFKQEPEKFWKIYKETLNKNKFPTKFHHFVYSFNDKSRIITQNTDGLHSDLSLAIDKIDKNSEIDKNMNCLDNVFDYDSDDSYDDNDDVKIGKVLEVHGNCYRVVCLNCLQKFPLSNFDNVSIPKCLNCGEILKPDISLFMEGINDFGIARDVIVETTDVLIVAGCSLRVGPTNELPLYLNWGKFTENENGKIVPIDNVVLSQSIWVNKEVPPEDYSFDFEFIMEADVFAELMNC